MATIDEPPAPVPLEVPPFYAGVVLWGQSGDLLLQLRDDVPGIVNPGMVGTFGGGGIEGERPEEAAIREIGEETGMVLTPDQLIPLERRERAFEGGLVIPVHMFGAVAVPDENLVITEGRLFRVTPDAIDTVPNITPGCLRASHLLIAHMAVKERKS